MSFWMILKVALRAILRNKTRSLLTMLGIIVGIAAVIAVLAIGTGASKQMVDQISQMGNNLVMIFSEQVHTTAGVKGAMGGGATLSASDGTAIRHELSHLVSAVSPQVQTTMQIVYEEDRKSTRLNSSHQIIS